MIIILHKKTSVGKKIKIILNLLSVWPIFDVYIIVLGIGSVAIPIIKIQVIEIIVKALLNLKYNSWKQFVLYVLLFSLTFLVELILQSRAFLDYFGLIYQQKYLNKNYSKFLINRANMPIELFEDIKLQDSLDQIRTFFSNDFSLMLITFQRIITIGVLTITTIVKIGQYNLFLALFLIFIAVVILFNNHRISQRNLEFEKQRTLANRMINYIYGIFVNKQALNEDRVYNNYGYIKNKWDKVFNANLENMNNHFKRVQTQQFITKIVSSVYSVISILLLYVLNFSLFKIDVASLIALIYTIQQYESNISSLMQRYHLVYRFFNLSEQILEFNDVYQTEKKSTKQSNTPLFNKLILKDVSYQYPRSDRTSVSQINLTINKGDKISIVGENGAGKTTLIRLVLGLIKPTKGEIQIDGVNISTIDLGAYYKHFSCVFQNTPKYALSFKENITLGRQNYNIEKSNLVELCERFSMNTVVEKLPNQYETILSKMIGEADLSGGEWQKLSIMRAIVRDSDIVILDEPTSAMDPLAEYELYKTINESLADKTVITISHRLASAKMADKIIFMKNGSIVEEGTHDELMRKKSFYFDLFSTQQQWYQRTQS